MTKAIIKNPYEGIERSQVLSLDMAIHAGFYCLNEGGTWDFSEPTSKKAPPYFQHKSFRDTLIECIKRNDIKLITAEDLIYAPGRFNATKKLGEFRGILLEVCDEFGLPDPIFVSPQYIKMNATGKGNANKIEVMAGVLRKWGIDTKGDDNWADAASCFYFTVNKYGIR